MFFVSIFVIKETDEREEMEGRGRGRKTEGSNRWWIWRSLCHAVYVKACLERAQTPEATLTYWGVAVLAWLQSETPLMSVITAKLQYFFFFLWHGYFSQPKRSSQNVCLHIYTDNTNVVSYRIRKLKCQVENKHMYTWTHTYTHIACISEPRAVNQRELIKMVAKMGSYLFSL